MRPKRVKILSMSSAAMPSPWSLTDTLASPRDASTLQTTRTSPPDGENFSALSTRLARAEAATVAVHHHRRVGNFDREGVPRTPAGRGFAHRGRDGVAQVERL